MSKTIVSISGTHFLINGKKTYSELPEVQKENLGLLMNARFIQGIFDERINPNQFNRFGKTFDPSENTKDLIKALPQWYAAGLRAFTVGLQGGGPCFTKANHTLDNNPFSEDGLKIDVNYLRRLDELICAADAIGMVVIVSYFYNGQTSRFKNAQTIKNAVQTASGYLKEQHYTNVLIEVCNEYNIAPNHPIISSAEGISVLMTLAKEYSGGMLVGSSGSGCFVEQEVCEASDYVLIHANGGTRQQYYKLIHKAKKYAPDKPILCNEDSQAIGNMVVGMKEGVSWGYYNNMTKQEPPIHWGITKGEDLFFAVRMAECLGIRHEYPIEEAYYLQGLEAEMIFEEKRWLRVASLYPETINFVNFYKNGALFYRSYVEPFSVNFESNWLQGSVEFKEEDTWTAQVVLVNGELLHLK